MDLYAWIASAIRYYGFTATWTFVIVIGMFVIDLVAFVTASAIARARR